MSSGLVISIVSHGHDQEVVDLLVSLDRKVTAQYKVIVRSNLRAFSIGLPKLSNLEVTMVTNSVPKGFGENHNLNFKLYPSEYFLILNPDIDLGPLNFSDFPNEVSKLDKWWVCTPAILDNGRIRKQLTQFPGIRYYLRRLLRRPNTTAAGVGWISGCFMLWRSIRFASLKGFDTNYYMYVEDADICWRCVMAGGSIRVFNQFLVRHDGRRESRRKAWHLAWHAKSLSRFFLRRAGIIKWSA